MRDTELDPLKLIAAFSRCQNYPRDVEGLRALAKGLQRASGAHHVSMCDIVDKCRELSEYCPTDYDLLKIAGEIAIAARPARPETCPFGLCDGSGWRETFNLWTRHGGEPASEGAPEKPAWIEKQAVTQEQCEDLRHKVDWKTQDVYAGRFRCKCHPAREPDAEPKRRGGKLQKVESVGEHSGKR